MFGTQPVWRGRVKVEVSDPTRTILDVLNDPEMAGGLRPAVDVLESYLKSQSRDLDRLLTYATRLGNGAVFKRLGFLLERIASKEEKAIAACRELMTQGNARLDPSVDNDSLMTRWRLWVPARWARESGHD
jgi:predicted transcriptional regulator of viral defense system